MDILLGFYLFFSFLFVMGVSLADSKIPFWNLLLAPITFPMILGKWFGLHKFDKK